MKKIFITGGTGFVGRQIIKGLFQKGYHLTCLIREGSESKLPIPKNIEIVYGDISKAENLKGNLEGLDAIIHLVGIIREFPKRGITFHKIHFQGSKNIIDIAVKEGVKRFILMSALGAEPNADTSYHKTKAQAEEYLKSSGLSFTIIKPSIIYGTEDQFVNTFAQIIKRMPFIPIIGDGTYQLQPISVKNVSEAFVKSLELPSAENESFEAGGPDKLEFNTIVDIISNVLGKKARKIHIPASIFKAIVMIMQRYSFFPITLDQMEMLLSGNICDERRFFDTFQIIPVSFREGIKSYLQD